MANGILVRTALLAVWLGAGAVGCATAPKDIGIGKYMHMYTESGLIASQSTFGDEMECERMVRSGWWDLTRNGLTPRCSSQDRQKELPFQILIHSAPYAVWPIEMRFRARDVCVEASNALSRDSHYRSTSYCYSSN